MKLYHPTIPGLTVTVGKRAVQDWLDQGWLKTAPKPVPGN